MAKKSVVARNNKRIKIAEKYQTKRQDLKAIVRDVNMSMKERMEAQWALASLPRDSAKIRQRNRCFITHRPRGVESFFMLSRMKIIDMSCGELPGLRKSSNH